MIGRSWEKTWTGKKVKKVYTETTKEKIGKIKPKKAKKLGAKLQIKQIANSKMTKKINGKWMPKRKSANITNASIRQQNKNIKILRLQLSTLKRVFNINLLQKPPKK